MTGRKRVKRWLVYCVARLVAAAWGLLPLPLALAFGRLFGAVAYPLAWSARSRAVAQLQDPFGMPEAEARTTARRLFSHLGRVVAEIVWLPRLTARMSAYVELDDDSRALLKDRLAEGKGVILISAHLGNWELLAQRIAHEGFDSVTVARPSPNPYIGAWLVRRRRRGGLEVIDRGDTSAARQILSALKRGAILGFLIDQDTRVQSTFVPFFGREASTPVAPAQLALRRNIPVIAGFIYRRPEGHRVHLESIPLDDLGEGTKEERVKAATARMTLCIEAAVRRAPEQWVWFHRRWRRRPTES